MHPGAPVHVEFIFKHGWFKASGKMEIDAYKQKVS